MANAEPGSGRPAGDPGSGDAPGGAAKKSTAKRAAKKAVPAKKAAAKKAVAKKAAPAKKVAAKKAVAKKAVPAKKVAAKKAVAKKAPPSAPAPSTAAATGTAPAAPAPRPADAAPPRPAPAARFPVAPGAVDRPWLASYPPLVPETYPYPEVALTRLLDDAAKDFPDSVATEFSGRTLTYRRLLDQVDRFATALQGLGVRKGDRVGIAMPNCPQHVVAFFGALRAGAVVVEHDPAADEDVLSYELDTAGCRVLVLSDPVYAKVAALKGRLRTLEHVIGTATFEALPPPAAALFRFRHRNDRTRILEIPAEEGVLRLADLIRRHPPMATHAGVDPREDLALLVFEQDTRQRRAVMLSHRNVLTNVFQVRLWIPDVQAGRETLLCAAPFWEPFGIVAGMVLGVLSAATMSLVADFDRDAVLQNITKRKPTIFPCTTAMIEALVAAPALRKAEVTSLRVCLCHGAALPADVAKTFEGATGGRVREVLSLLGATAVTHASPVYGKAKPERLGLPLTDTVCAVIDRSGAVAEQGRPGELVIHGPQVARGYLQRPEDTAATFVDGWLRTGLLAEIDADGYVAVLGRVRG